MIKECYTCKKPCERYYIVTAMEDAVLCRNCKKTLLDSLDKSDDEIIKAIKTLKEENYEIKYT